MNDPTSNTIPTSDPVKADLIKLGHRAHLLIESGTTQAVVAFAMQIDEPTIARAVDAYIEHSDPDRTIREWATELHPAWCHVTEAIGCGTHYSEPVDTAATANVRVADCRAGVPFAGVAAVMFDDGTRGVSMQADNAKHGTSSYREVEVWFTPTEAREHAALVLRMAELAESDAPMGTRPRTARGVAAGGAA